MALGASSVRSSLEPAGLADVGIIRSRATAKLEEILERT
jgi:hypothetical protein